MGAAAEGVRWLLEALAVAWILRRRHGKHRLLALALRDLPVGTAYAAWTGIGAVGTAVFGIVLLGESGGGARLVSIALVAAGIAGLRLFGD